jgi:hypothetical protein
MKRLVLLIAIVLVLFNPGCATKKVKLDPRATNGAEVHMSPTEWSLVNYVLPPNSEIQNIEIIQDCWVKIKTPTIPGHGWFFSGLVGLDNSSDTNAEVIGPYIFKVIKDGTAVKKAPDVFSEETKNLKRGDEVWVVAKQGCWLVTDNGQFILADLVYQDEPL